MITKNFVVQAGHYPFDIMFSFNQSKSQFDKCLKKLGLDDFVDDVFYEETCMARTVNIESGQTIIRFKDFRKTPNGYSILAHEIWHAVELLMFKLNTPHHIEYNSETYAYLIQYITEKVYDQIGV